MTRNSELGGEEGRVMMMTMADADGRLRQVTAGLDGALFLLLKRPLKVMY